MIFRMRRLNEHSLRNLARNSPGPKAGSGKTCARRAMLYAVFGVQALQGQILLLDRDDAAMDAAEYDVRQRKPPFLQT
jgi:hypothetical protein